LFLLFVQAHQKLDRPLLAIFPQKAFRMNRTGEVWHVNADGSINLGPVNAHGQLGVAAVMYSSSHTLPVNSDFNLSL
jgi:hypothetical protein